jgi:hypothetical protein
LKLNKSLFFTVAATLLMAVLPLVSGYAADFILPGSPVPPTGCRQSAVLSTDQFTTTGIPQVRTVQPNETVVAGAWVLADSYVPETSVVAAAHCPNADVGLDTDSWPTNVIGMKINTSIGNAKDMDLQELDLYWDVNMNGQLDPGLDLLMQVHTESDLTDRLNDENKGIVWYNGPESPIFVLGDPSHIGFDQCTVDAVKQLQTINAVGLHAQANPGNYNGMDDPCAVGVLAVAKVGPNPKTGADFALQLYAKAADVPGAFGGPDIQPVPAPGQPVQASPISSEFAPSHNPQASNILLVATGGHASTTETPVANISNGSGAVESDIVTLNSTNLKTRFREDPIKPGSRDAIAIMVAVCDGSAEANNQVTFLPPIAGAPPTIAGGLAALPCIASAGTDGFNTGVNGAVLIFSGPGAKYIRTVRMWGDLCGQNTTATCTPGGYDQNGGGDGILFQADEQIQQVTARFNPATGEAIAIFGQHQEQIFQFPPPSGQTQIGLPVLAVDPLNTVGGGNPNPEILTFTADIGEDAIGAKVDVRLGLQVGDDTAQGPQGICALETLGTGNDTANCGSNLLTIGPETSSFEIVGPTPPPTPPPPPVPPSGNVSIEKALDVDSNCVLDDPEVIAAVGFWTNGTAVTGTVPPQTINDPEILKLAALWTTGNNLCAAAAAGVEQKSTPSLWEQILNIFSPKSSALSGTQAATATQVNPGSSFEVTVNVKANQAQGGLILSEQLPAGWTATPVASGSAYAKASEPKWLWLGMRGQTSVTYRVNVPADAQAGSYQIGGALTSANADHAALAPLAIAVAGETQALAVESIKAQALDGGSTQFVVSGSGVAGLQVQVYDLSGKVVFNQETNGTTLTFHGQGVDGQMLANGVYLYAVTVKGLNGQSVTTEVKKLVVLR